MTNGKAFPVTAGHAEATKQISGSGEGRGRTTLWVHLIVLTVWRLRVTSIIVNLRCSVMGFLRRTVPFLPLPDSVEDIEAGTGRQHWEHIQWGEAVVHPWMEEVR